MDPVAVQKVDQDVFGFCFGDKFVDFVGEACVAQKQDVELGKEEAPGPGAVKGLENANLQIVYGVYFSGGQWVAVDKGSQQESRCARAINVVLESALAQFVVEVVAVGVGQKVCAFDVFFAKSVHKYMMAMKNVHFFFCFYALFQQKQCCH